MTRKPPLNWITAAVIAILSSSVAAASNYTQYFDTLYNETTGWGALRAVTNTYEATVGASLFWVLMVSMPFICMWIKQQSVAVASVVALISGGLLMALVPPEFDLPIKILLTLAI
jgi:hypothetical protein